jgi:hypothetical protein
MFPFIIGWLLGMAAVFFYYVSVKKVTWKSLYASLAVGIVLGGVFAFIVYKINVTGWIVFALGFLGGILVKVIFIPWFESKFVKP